MPTKPRAKPDRGMQRIKVLAGWEKMMREQDTQPALAIAINADEEIFLLRGGSLSPMETLGVLELAAKSMRAVILAARKNGGG